MSAKFSEMKFRCRGTDDPEEFAAQIGFASENKLAPKEMLTRAIEPMMVSLKKRCLECNCGPCKDFALMADEILAVYQKRAFINVGVH